MDGSTFRTLSVLGAPGSVQRFAETLELARTEVRGALRGGHLVDVSATLRASGLSDGDLRTVGIPTDVLSWFPAWREGSREGFAPPSSGLVPVPAGAGNPLGTLRLQLSPAAGTIPMAVQLVRALLARADPETRITLVVEPGANRDGLRALLRDTGRVEIVELRSATLFAQDNARPMHDVSGARVLLVPRAFRSGGHRAEDALEPKAAGRAFGVPVRRSTLFWEGGNLLFDGELLLLGADSVRENMVRLGLTSGEVAAAFAAELGLDPVILGDVERARFDVDQGRVTRSGQASFHIDLDVAPLGRFGRKARARALVADAARGLELLDAVLERRSMFRGQVFRPAEAREQVAALYDESARSRHPQLLAYAAALEKRGYRVFGVPDLRIEQAENVFRGTNFDFTYCNVLAGRCRSRPAVHWLPYGIPALDDAAEGRYRAAGVEPVRISRSPQLANRLMNLFGGLHCFCGTLT